MVFFFVFGPEFWNIFEYHATENCYLPDPYCLVIVSGKAWPGCTGSGMNYNYLGRTPPPLE